ncbi:glutamate-1-semialdehyde 2,1-aminomutase [Selenomonas sputigena]|uniref:Glutamate-1-semialdehyde 2,1-aminomutase n=1 Tax=Selenomonas sputigena (strain ATCC 35185 / DSM 20758 / CCUG 44933 / VPI D19B-28) TaxID=546271 RepID=C9LXY1_SELS3|nr:glutamate-1-semialdehyde 2,1-aminomutase [Selenomonas sputigena]AEB99332.1 glutamate-1-semialdehyde-2,1-aminomutase [Selenomonas sputigena ATCC 35185]EEX76175.1 glutamate-1-semialdehyde-2,1-aminomutase [Selenomonas sputigena ATCC 35185]
MLNLEKSLEAFEEAKTLMPGGVNSPVRSYRNVDCNPPFIARGEGAHIFDIDGNEYVDYVLSWGPLVAGHAHPAIVSALADAAARGTSYGAPTTLESDLVRLVQKAYPSMQLVRMVNSGTEATMSALRLARGFTGRSKIVKFVGCYHGHSDSLLVDAGSGLATFGVPSSPGVTEGVAKDTITVPFNDTDAITRVMTEYGKDVACIIVEPVAGNMGCVLPENGYLDTLRALTEKHGALLIFDEVMCGFRASLGGAQAAYGITPDLTCLGKIIGGGLPCAAYGGRRDIMEQIAPAGPVYQAGTLSGNPLAMTAGIETLKLILKEPEPGEADASRALTLKTKKLVLGLESAAREAGVKIQAHQAGSMFSIFFSAGMVKDYASSAASDQEAFKVWFRAMLEQGIYLAPSQFETLFLSLAHTDEDIDRTIAAAEKAFVEVKSKK